MSNDNQNIKIQFDRMDQKKNELMNLIRSLSAENYLRQPDQFTWSAGQIANHLYLSERQTLAYLKKKLSYPDQLLPFSIRSWWSLYAANFILWSPVKVKAPPQINMWKETEILSPDDLNRKWNEIREEMNILISDHLPRFNRHLVFNHPFTGRMTMLQMLVFFNHHIAHHQRQMKRVLKKNRINS